MICGLSESQITLGAMAQLSCGNHIMFMHFVHSFLLLLALLLFLCFYSIFKTLSDLIYSILSDRFHAYWFAYYI